MFSYTEEKTDKMYNQPDMHRAVTATPQDSSGSSTSSNNSRSASLSAKRSFDVDPIKTPPSSNNQKAHSPEGSPDADGDPELYELLINGKPPFSEHLHIEKFLKNINQNPPATHNFQLIHAEKTRQKESLELYITTLDIADLTFLSLYMNSIQVGNLSDDYFKTIRTECGGFGWFQTYGNTKTWQHIRSTLKDEIAKQLKRSEIPGKKKPIDEGTYESYLQIFEQHSGRAYQLKSWLLPSWFPWFHTRSEQQFIDNYSLDKSAPAIPIKAVRRHRT